MSQPESKLSRAIKDAIKARGGYCIKIHGGPMTEAGTPDILACIPVHLYVVDTAASPTLGTVVELHTVGLMVGIETKMPAGGNPTPIQEHRHGQIRAAGGVVIVARSVQDVTEALEALGCVRVPRNPG